ncbi:MAG: peptidylprolyl isomerase [Alphaproteobacteria bacterium]|nr:peptidylprolyl isomerase [Alphaproteobacteria bacterium]
MFKKLAFLFLCSLVYVTSANAAQIVATVDDEIITSQDLQDRMKMMEKLYNVSSGKIPKDKVLDALINEKVQIITAKNAGISLTAEEVKEHIAMLEKQMPQGSFKQFIEENGISEDTWMAQILSGLFWIRYVQHQNIKRPTVSEKEIDAQIKKIRQEFKQPAYLLAEIYIPFDKDEKAAHELADSLFERIVGGESFTDLALTYSKGKTADQMGDLGWVKAGQLEKAIDKILPELKPGQLSKPIKGKKGYTILLMRDYQAPLDSDEQEVIQASQLVLHEQDYEKIKPELENAARSCMLFTQFASTHGLEDSHSGALPEMVVSRMPGDLKKILDGHKVGELIGPIEMSPYVLFVMKCGSRFISVIPSRDEIKMELETEKMEKEAEKILKEARKKLFVEIK